MLSYKGLTVHPTFILPLTGLSKDKFDALTANFAASLAPRDSLSSTHTGGSYRQLQRAVWAGDPRALNSPTRLLMLLVSLRLYPPYSLPRWSFRLEKPNVWENLPKTLESLGTPADLSFQRPSTERAESHTDETVLSKLPQFRLIVGSKKQSILRHGRRENQKLIYSDKRCRHMAKVQLACEPERRDYARSAHRSPIAPTSRRLIGVHGACRGDVGVLGGSRMGPASK